MTKQHILDYLSMHKPEFQKKYGVEEIGLFGSYARDEAKDDSDVDIFVSMQAKFDNVMGLKYDLETSLQKKVDLMTKHKYMKPFLLQMITKDVIYV
ncbi:MULTISPECIES: nucleotidyltransferase family protein [Sulfurospirillum]|jgi:predicted nucleotidyltransferase|uniref:nucleotidyltransferase family protein n=1 Tax=Sulfurospirillum TaxID=57665 RepID=UPI000543AC0D|nr:MULTISPECIES: nucleotidyltransferase family protein [Sulfurospirillum]KHG34399.1 MAG: hypothetical protein OA34_04675 [Sulfurospirillum sp. MES]MCP3650871.1 nucleotidyltransferase family protein [Sulfurospirillum sp. DNRA8]MCR1809717.1 nucleotidyltransferase family protein [Sulfurospirillum sp. DNRA8]